MPKAILPTRNEEIFAGFVHYTLTDVFFGHDGIENLKHFVPFAQSDWQFFEATPGHDFLFDFDSVTSRISARQQATVAPAQVSQIRRRIILPLDFGSFVTDGIRLIVFRGATAPVSYKVTLLKDGVADPGVDGVDIQASAASTFELKQLTPTAAYFPGDFVTLELEHSSNGSGQFNQVADVEIEYLTARGNV